MGLLKKLAAVQKPEEVPITNLLEAAKNMFINGELNLESA